MDYLISRSVVFADLLNNLIRAGRSQAGNNAHSQGGQGIGGRERAHATVAGGGGHRPLQTGQ